MCKRTSALTEGKIRYRELSSASSSVFPSVTWTVKYSIQNRLVSVQEPARSSFQLCVIGVHQFAERSLIKVSLSIDSAPH